MVWAGVGLCSAWMGRLTLPDTEIYWIIIRDLSLQNILATRSSCTNQTTLQWPAKSPYLNIIENLWSVLKYQLHRRLDEIRSEDDLTSVAREIWVNIPLKCTEANKTGCLEP